MVKRETETGGRIATDAVIPGSFGLSVGMPNLPPPPGFTWTKLSDLARLESGHTPNRSSTGYWNGEIPWIGIRDATGNHGKTIYTTNQYITQDGLDNSSARLLPAGTVCLSRTASVGFVVRIGIPMATSQDFVNWVCGPNLASGYLHYLLMAEQDSIRRFAHGSVHQTMYYPEAKALHVCVPTRPVQDVIVGVLGALDDKIAANTRRAEVTSDLAGLLFDECANSSPEQPVSDILSPILGGTPSRSRVDLWNGEYLWASAKDVTAAAFGVVLDTEKNVSHLAVSTTKVKPLPRGSVVLTARGTVGAVARLGEASCFNQSCYGFRPGALPEGVLYYSILRAARRVKEIAHGSVFDTITMKTFGDLYIPRLTESETRQLEARLGPLLTLVEQSVRENKSLASTRDALLPELMSGRLRVKDAEKTVEEVL